MSIALKNRIIALEKRVESLEMKFNIMNTTPRNVAGTPDPTPDPVKKKGRPPGSLNKKK